MLATEILYPFEVGSTARTHPALALDDFQQHRGRIVSQRRFQRLQLIVGHVPETGRQGADVLAVLGVPGRRQGSQGATVVATHGSDNVRFARAHASKFNRAFNGLGTRVAEKEAIQPRRGNGCELCEQRSSAVVIEQLRAGDQRFRLLRQRFRDHGMAVSKTGHTHASGTIDVLLALLIPQARSLTPHNGDAPFGVYPTGIALLELLYGRHVRSFSVLPSPALAAPVEWAAPRAHLPGSLCRLPAPGLQRPPSSYASYAPARSPYRTAGVPCQYGVSANWHRAHPA